MMTHASGRLRVHSFELNGKPKVELRWWIEGGPNHGPTTNAISFDESLLPSVIMKLQQAFRALSSQDAEKQHEVKQLEGIAV